MNTLNKTASIALALPRWADMATRAFFILLISLILTGSMGGCSGRLTVDEMRENVRKNVYKDITVDEIEYMCRDEKTAMESGRYYPVPYGVEPWTANDQLPWPSTTNCDPTAGGARRR